MEDAVDRELGLDGVQQFAVEDRAGIGAAYLRIESRLERPQVDRDDALLATARKVIDQGVADLAGGAGDHDNRLSHGVLRNLSEEAKMRRQVAGVKTQFAPGQELTSRSAQPSTDGGRQPPAPTGPSDSLCLRNLATR